MLAIVIVTLFSVTAVVAAAVIFQAVQAGRAAAAQIRGELGAMQRPYAPAFRPRVATAASSRRAVRQPSPGRLAAA
jgi:hypothetical protein